jgi:hypothetical protein
MAEQRAKIHSIQTGHGEYTGQSFSALPIVIHAKDHEEADARIAPFYLACVELAEQFEGIEIPNEMRTMMECCLVAAAAIRTTIYAEEHRQ